uniref:Uncharacterized protein n=1 Tax=Anopheles farauti TaxID=69004 RepID=A0A182QSG6_9DIPT
MFPIPDPLSNNAITSDQCFKHILHPHSEPEHFNFTSFTHKLPSVSLRKATEVCKSNYSQPAAALEVNHVTTPVKYRGRSHRRTPDGPKRTGLGVDVFAPSAKQTPPQPKHPFISIPEKEHKRTTSTPLGKDLVEVECGQPGGFDRRCEIGYGFVSQFLGFPATLESTVLVNGKVTESQRIDTATNAIMSHGFRFSRWTKETTTKAVGQNWERFTIAAEGKGFGKVMMDLDLASFARTSASTKDKHSLLVTVTVSRSSKAKHQGFEGVETRGAMFIHDRYYVVCPKGSEAPGRQWQQRNGVVVVVTFHGRPRYAGVPHTAEGRPLANIWPRGHTEGRCRYGACHRHEESIPPPVTARDVTATIRRNALFVSMCSREPPALDI